MPVTTIRRPAQCALGIHRPHRPSTAIDAEGMRYAICRDCGCDLKRTAATRRWFFNGLLA